MRLLLKMVAALFIGTALGLFATSFALRSGFSFERVQAGAWTGLPRATSGGDPYLRAQVSRSALAPLAPAEGMSFIARTDSALERLDARCAYTLSGAVPQARLWTLSLLENDGSAPQGERRGFTSAELVRDERGGFSIALARGARPGNHLTLPVSDRFILMLRLYDTPSSMHARGFEPKDLPTIRKERCG